MIARRMLLGVVAAVLLCAAGPGGGEKRAADQPYVEASLVSEVMTAPRDGVVWVAMRQKIASGWHTYWRYPGDSGLPPRLDWKLPEGVSAGPIHWPRPNLYRVGPLVNFGYADEVMLLVPITISREARLGDALEIAAEAEWLVCEDICIPERATLSLSLPVGETARFDPTMRPHFVRYRSLLPDELSWPGRASRDRDRLVLRLLLPPDIARRVTGATFFPGDDGMIDNRSAQNVNINGAELTVAMTAGDRIGRDLRSLEGLLVIRETRHGRTSERDLRIGPLPIDSVSNRSENRTDR